LRQALLTANNTPAPDLITISFARTLAGGNIAITTRFAPITRDGITIIGLTSNNQPNITIDASQVTGCCSLPILFIAASSFSMSGLRFSPIPVTYNAIQIGGLTSPPQTSGVNISGNVFSNGTGEDTPPPQLTKSGPRRQDGCCGFAIYVRANQSNETIGNVTIANNTFDHLFEAILLQGGGEGATNSVVQDVVIYGNVFSQMTSYAGVEMANGSNSQIRRTQILHNNFQNSAQGVFLNSTDGTQNTIIDSTLIAGNVFTAVTDPNVGLGSIGASNNTITNTQIVNNIINQGTNSQQSGGIGIGANQAVNNTVACVTIANNTFAGPLVYGAVSVLGSGVSGVTVFNTIFYGNQVGGMTPDQVSYSIINQSGFTGVNHNFNADPLFVNPANNDFHLQSGSPALHAGTSNGAPPIDLDCQPRGSPPSIGAYEFDGPNICTFHPRDETLKK
jgi:hypothetical protein